MKRISTLSIAIGISFALVSAAGHAQDSADLAALGKKLATNNCAVCHTFGKGEPNGQGPNLFGIVGRPMGAQPGFKYSAGMHAASSGKVWDEKLLDAWLSDTQTVAPGNAMTYFEGDEARRRKIIAYLSTLH
ncbi:Cytochrome c class I [Paraburkholderia piptadeniae]|uniref:Cytochrome c class I n=1 Tax=Paraburkholderia piptadeniae TaxID=1701573 RepID=A0A1N7RQ94_9BURK|nr:c-type cytochrome [Paraburkholderia piptadeniae]SIT37305.1 Cytochrome c class I [Paraburkholderia piptadeniae]